MTRPTRADLTAGRVGDLKIRNRKLFPQRPPARTGTQPLGAPGWNEDANYLGTSTAFTTWITPFD